MTDLRAEKPSSTLLTDMAEVDAALPRCIRLLCRLAVHMEGLRCKQAAASPAADEDESASFSVPSQMVQAMVSLALSVPGPHCVKLCTSPRRTFWLSTGVGQHQRLAGPGGASKV